MDVVGRMVTVSQFLTADYRAFTAEIQEPSRVHRKQWEFYAITRTLEHLGMLRDGMRGLVFAVGTEPLPALFAKKGAYIVATDMDPSSFNTMFSLDGWSKTAQYANSLEPLRREDICPREVFDKRVIFRHADMNHIPPEFFGKFDFVWSSCSVEHVGSITLGKRFLVNVMDVLKPGGVSIHTTELNLSSLDRTIEAGGSVIFRKKDLDDVSNALRILGHEVADIDYNSGNDPHDLVPDRPPFSVENHVKLKIGEYTSASVLFIARKRSA